MLVYILAVALISQCHCANIVDILASDSKASTLNQLVNKAGLGSVLKAGTFTVFAPTDAAFAKVDQATLSSLLTDTNKLADLLKYHVLSGTVRSSDITNEMQPTTVAGSKMRLNTYSHNHVVTANGAAVVEADRSADNGIIHFIDEVIMPPTQSIVQLVQSDPQFSILLSAVTKAGIVNEFLANPETVFAPTNDAFSRLDAKDLTKLLGDSGRLKETLEYHAIPHTLFAKGLYNHEFPKSSDSHEDRLHVRVSGSGVSINNAKVTKADIQATNGVVHKIDHVLIPIRVGFWLRSNFGK